MTQGFGCGAVVTAMANLVRLGNWYMTERQRRILELLGTIPGIASETIADEIGWSVRVVKRDLADLYRRLGVEGAGARERAALVYRRATGKIEDPDQVAQELHRLT